MNTPTEHQEQALIFQWAELNKVKYPELKLLNGNLNGVRLTIGQAVKAKAAGMKKGFPDISLPVPKGNYHGLFIELKRIKPKGYASPEQKEWLEDLRGQGYCCAVCYGFEEARQVICDYLQID